MRARLLLHRHFSRPRIHWRRVGFLSTGVALTLGTFIYADGPPDQFKPKKPLSELIRSYFVYSMCSFPALVDSSPTVLSVLSSVPIVKQITEAFVRVTFFNQFVGANTAVGALPLLHSLRASNKGALFAYSVEVDELEATASSSKREAPPYKRIVNEMIHCIDVAADFEDAIVGNSPTGRRTWVAIKMTALLPDAQALINFSSHIISTRPTKTIPFPNCPRPNDLDVLYTSAPSSSLSPQDIASLKELHSDLIRICTRAQERGVKIIIDAEYSWYQPAIDALQLSLMRQFNHLSSRGKVQPLVYGTYQAYLRRTPDHLRQSLIDAKEHNFALGVKLVRGAYHPHELIAYHAQAAGRPSLSISPDPDPPVWTSKAETDKCYNECAKVLINAIHNDISAPSAWSWIRRPRPQNIGVLFGTHNWESCNLILNELLQRGLASAPAVADEDKVFTLSDNVTERLTIGQLYGMSDALTEHLIERTRSRSPLIIKYVPYGALSEVMPYLSRRAIENKSILGNGAASEERRHAGAEIRKRLFG